MFLNQRNQCNQTNQRFGYFFLDSQGEFLYSPSHKKQRLITITRSDSIHLVPDSTKSRIPKRRSNSRFLKALAL